MPVRLPAPVRAALAALTVALAVALTATACTPKPTLAELDRKLYAASPAAFDHWWRGEQAAAHRVGRATIDRWLVSSPQRLDAAAARARAWDVSTDLCSFAPDTGPVHDFRLPCIRHDFAWRNLRRIDRQHGGGVDTRARRLVANRQFLRDMEAACAKRPVVQRTSCGAVARTYFAAVTVVS
jgi:hypothetical protein